MAKNNKRQKTTGTTDGGNILIFGGSLEELVGSSGQNFNIVGELRMFEYSINVDEETGDEFDFFEQQVKEAGYAGLIRAQVSVEHFYDEGGSLKKYFLLQGVPIRRREE